MAAKALPAETPSYATNSTWRKVFEPRVPWARKVSESFTLEEYSRSFTVSLDDYAPKWMIIDGD